MEAKEFFSKIDLSALPSKAADYIKSEILTDGNLDLITTEDEDFLAVKHKIESLLSKQNVSQSGSTDENISFSREELESSLEGANITLEYPKVQLKGDNRAFWYVVRSEGDKYILVFEEKIDDWKSASNIEKYEYYEEIGNKEDYEPYTQVQTEEDDKASWEELKELAEAMISVTKGKEKKEWIEAKELAEAMLEV
jgi:hypothetical protein